MERLFSMTWWHELSKLMRTQSKMSSSALTWNSWKDAWLPLRSVMEKQILHDDKHLGYKSHKTCFKQQNKTEHWLLLVLKQYEYCGKTDSSAAVNPEVKAEHTWNPKHQNVKFTFSSQFIYQLARRNVLLRSHVAGLFFSLQDKKISVSV